jgi:uncharacterized protein (DUF697 family)
MNRKKLPKAIVRASDDEPFPLANGAPEAGAETSKGRDPSSPRRGREQGGNVIEMTPLPAVAGRIEHGSAGPASSAVEAKRRRSRALAIVGRYAAGSAIGGMIPLPVVTFAWVTAIIVRMVKALSDHYGVPFERDRARAIVIGLVGGAMPAGVAAVTTSTLAYILPPAAVMGLAVSAISAAGFTRSVGRIFIEHFESGATLEDFSSNVLPHSLTAA